MPPIVAYMLVQINLLHGVLQRIGASVPLPGNAMSDDVQASNQRDNEEAAALAKAAAEAERKVRFI